MEVTVYRITGKQGKVNVPDWVCRECDLTVAAVRRACEDAGVSQERITVRPWLARLREALGKGAYHPPVVLINGLVFSQGIVPDVAALTAHLRSEAARQGTAGRAPSGG